MGQNVVYINAGVTELTTKGDLLVFGVINARLPVGADTYHLVAASAEPLGVKWEAVVAGGDVFKVATPLNNQVGVWTGDGTMEGTTGLTYSGTVLAVSGSITVTGTVDGIDIATDVAANTAKLTNVTTDLSYTASPTNGTVTSSDGTNATVTLATGTNAGLLAPADFTILSNTSGSNSGDQTSIAGITGTKAQFDTAVTDGNFMYTGDAPTAHTHLLSAGATDINATAAELNVWDLSATALTIGWGYFADGASLASWRQLLGSEISNTESWAADQTTIVGITGTKAQFDTAVTDGNFLYVGDVTGNVSTALSIGTITATTFGITSDGSANDVILPEANTTQAGILGSDKWDEIVANTLKTSNANHTGDATGATALTLATVNTDVGTYSNAKVTVNGKGLITAVSELATEKALTIESPISGDDIAMFFTDVAITVTQINDVLVGTTSITWNIYRASTRNAAGTKIFTADRVTSSVTGAETTTINSASIAAGSWVWFKASAASGTPTQLTVSMTYTID